MARALIVGCGCRGRVLGAALLERGWQVRGSTREPDRLGPIEAAGIEGVIADPDRAGTVVEQLESVAVVVWALASLSAEPGARMALHGPRLERVLEKLVDSPVRGFVYEGEGTVGAAVLRAGATTVTDAGRRWRIPVAITREPAQPAERWLAGMVDAIEGVLG